MAEPHDSLLAVIGSGADRSFEGKTVEISSFLTALTQAELVRLLGQAGFIPEVYDHDSSEEKLYAKSMDLLTAEALERLGYSVEVTTKRGNRADLEATWNGDASHAVVLDAKAFRLSRTALNPKDYKISALSTWRHDADYAALVGPIAGFPQGRSRVYAESVRHEVPLLTFSHLQFLLEQGTEVTPAALGPLWAVGLEVRKVAGAEPDATRYWAVVDQVLCSILGLEIPSWQIARRRYFSDLLEVAQSQLDYLEARASQVADLDREELVALLSAPFTGKATQIRRKIELAERLIAEIEAAEH